MASIDTATPETGSARLDSLTGLRFIAAFFVFAYDGSVMLLFADQKVQSRYGFWAGNIGHMGVSFFFVLSGFVLTWTAASKDTAALFWRRRIVKIFPNHVVTFAVAIALLIAGGFPIMTGQMLANLFLVHTWVPGASFIEYSINGVSWSLAAEVFFYAAFPFLLPLILKIKPERLWLWFLGFAGCALLVPETAFLFLPNHPANPFGPGMSWPQMWFAHFFPVTRAFEFLAGMVMARIVVAGRWIRLPMTPAAVLVGVVYVIGLHLPVIYGFAAIYPVPVGLLIAAAATSDSRGRRTWLNSRPAVWLGDASYAFYLTHLIALFYVHAYLSGHQWAGYGAYNGKSFGTLEALTFLVAMLVVCVGIARTMFLLVERPMMRRWSRPKSARRVPAPIVEIPAEPALEKP